MKLLAAIVLVLCACSGTLPETKYYQLVAPPAVRPQSELVVAIEPFDTDPAYDDERIVYRTSPYRLAYYEFHRWIATPGVLITQYLEQAFAHSGQMRTVRTADDRTTVVIGGRVIVLEEIDESPTQWIGHIVLELTATDTSTGHIVWSRRYEDREPLRVRSPDGLAEAISIAMARIGGAAAMAVAEVAHPDNGPGLAVGR